MKVATYSYLNKSLAPKKIKVFIEGDLKAPRYLSIEGDIYKAVGEPKDTEDSPKEGSYMLVPYSSEELSSLSEEASDEIIKAAKEDSSEDSKNILSKDIKSIQKSMKLLLKRNGKLVKSI